MMTSTKSIKRSLIQWTHFTINFWVGCTRVSAGCVFCYMYRLLTRLKRDPKKVHRTGHSTFYKAFRLEGRQLLFTCSLSDFYHEAADKWRADAWDVIQMTPQHFWQQLTKRPENIRERLPADWGEGYDHVWLGISVENQECADKRIPELLNVPAKVYYLSVEPMLGPITIPRLKEFHWVIVGGESGNRKGAFRYRPCEVAWIQSIADQCAAAGVPCFVKQLGTHLYHELNLSDRHGGKNPDEWPEGLRVRQMPRVYVEAMKQSVQKGAV